MNKGTKEGDICNRNECAGTMEFEGQEGCDCDNLPEDELCEDCTNAKAVFCDVCGSHEDE